MFLAKAFDTVSLPILLRKLESLGIRGTPYNWFESYLVNRCQSVKVGNYTSEALPVSFGVPQGSILGPTLFTIYVNDLLNMTIDNATTICYADDTVVLFQGKSWEETYKTAEKGLSLVSHWLDSNLLTINTTKTKYLAFHKTSASAPLPEKQLVIHKCKPSINCNCATIERSSSIKYLGVQIDDKLSFKKQIQFVSARLRKMLYILKTLRHSASRDVLSLVYTSLCQSIIIYCIGVWGGAAKTIFVEIERAQRAVLKVMLNKPYRFPTDSLYSETKLLRVRQLYMWRVTCAQHSKTISSLNYKALLRKRTFKVPIPSVRSTFAKRLPLYSHPYIYNKIIKKLDMKNLTTRQAKHIVKTWLMDLTYIETEQLLPTND